MVRVELCGKVCRYSTNKFSVREAQHLALGCVNGCVDDDEAKARTMSHLTLINRDNNLLMQSRNFLYFAETGPVMQ